LSGVNLFLPSPVDERPIWRLRKGASKAQARICRLNCGDQLQLKVDDEIVFACLFQHGAGRDQMIALASSARAELEVCGWVLADERLEEMI
jgi:hypothetical protein